MLKNTLLLISAPQPFQNIKPFLVPGQYKSGSRLDLAHWLWFADSSSNPYVYFSVTFAFIHLGNIRLLALLLGTVSAV